MIRKVGNYQLLTEVSRETLGTVYLGRHEHIDRDVHVLLVDESLGSQDSFRKRFLREMRSVARLNHPFILRVLDLGVAEGALYAIMEHEAASTPSASDASRLAPVAAYRLASMIATALMHAHLKGILHRDLRPGNVWLRTDGTPLVRGFGLAGLLAKPACWADPGRVASGGEHRAFTAPEVLEGGTADARGDVWSLGAMLAFFLTGQEPFPVSAPSQSLRDRRLNLPPAMRATLSPRAIDLLQRLTAHDPAGRPTSLYEIKTELEDLALQQAAAHVIEEQGKGYEAGVRFEPEGGLGSYEVLEKLGEGGFGAVYKVQDGRSGRHFALKVMKQQGEADSSSVSRFRREWEALRAVRHPNIVEVIEVGQLEETLYFVMEFIEGTDLRRHMRESGAPRPSEAVHIASEVARALGAAHAAGIVHRDLSPSNILLDPGGRVVLTDFGVAHMPGKTRLTITGDFMGTPAYMAPELIHGRPPDPRSDLFSLGVILYEMLAGAPPFQAESVWDLFKQIASKEPDVHGVLPREVPTLLKAVLLRLLEKDPAHRYACAEELLADLARVEAEMGEGG